MKKNRTTKAVILAFILVLIAGASFLIIRGQNKSKTEDTRSDKTPQTQINPTSNDKTSDQNYLVIKEWNVKFPDVQNDGFHYSISNNAATIYSDSAAKIVGGSGVSCKDEYIGYLYRQKEGQERPELPFNRVKKIGEATYWQATHKQYGPMCLAKKQTGDYATDTNANRKFDAIISRFQESVKDLASN